jgi:AraC-like DNA-binding protein/quercetin dioxygenase-like cupin family protein
MSHRCQSVLRGRNGKPFAEIVSVSADLAHGHVIAEHSHPEDQLLFATQGVMTVRTKQGVWVVPSQRAVWIPAETVHSVAISGKVSMRTLYLLPRRRRDLPRKCVVINVSPLLKELILHACTFPKLRKIDATERRIIDIIFDQLKVVESVPLQLPHPSDGRAMRVAKLLFEDPGDERSLDALCRDCGASKRTVQRLFLDGTGMTFAKWRQQLRLLHATQLLASGEKVAVAALESGYSSASAFISMFRKQLGTTPARFLESRISPSRTW